MTVGELIDQLVRYPRNLAVVSEDTDGWVAGVTSTEQKSIQVYGEGCYHEAVVTKVGRVYAN